jgi:hypothetical protein
MPMYLEGVVLKFDEVFCPSSGRYVMVKARAFDTQIADGDTIPVHIEHGGRAGLRPAEIFATKTALIFRAEIPEKFADQFVPFSDSALTYFAASAGFDHIGSHVVKCSGSDVHVAIEAKLSEISLVKKPAIESTFVRIVTRDDESKLQDDAELIELAGRVININRAIDAGTTGEMKYWSVESDYDRAAARFTRMLSELT